MKEHTLKEILRISFARLSDWFFMIIGHYDGTLLEISRMDYNNQMLEVRVRKPGCSTECIPFIDDEDVQAEICKVIERDPEETGWFVDWETFTSLDEMIGVVKRIKADLKPYEKKERKK